MLVAVRVPLHESRPRSGFTAVTAHGGTGNRILAALPASDLDLLGPELELIALEQDAVLSRTGDDIEYVIFPHKGAITLMIDMADGQTVATAIIGREGAVGLLSVLGPSPSAITAVVRAAGPAVRIPASRFHVAFSRSPGDPACGPELRQVDADTVPGRRGLQRLAPGRSPYGALDAPASRRRRP